MSVDKAQPRRPPHSPGDAKLVRYDAYIDKQIRTTSRTVKVVDFATAIVLLIASVLAFLLTAAVVEHWLVPGGYNFVVRCLLFMVLVVGIGYFSYRRIWPLCMSAINPVYAAQTIEHGSPTLKNSLINLLLFRQRRSGISDAVYKTLEEQAAQRLTRAPTDSSVDRTQLIRFGYVLLVVAAAAGLYKVLSPKDPLIAAERVLMPWADIVPASRVQIAGVEPGSVTITRGEFVDVSAEVLGIGEKDDVFLRFTTADGRAVNKPIAMKATNTGLRYVGRLPDANAEGGSSGVAQSLTYRIEAGDARTLDYPVTVISAPAILVERIDYDYPQYTGFVDTSVEASREVPEPGPIRAIEGTRVTIHARANGPIDSADVDFDADGRRDLKMTVDGERAKTTFELALREDRQTPKHLSYVLRLTNAEGRTNRDPVKHPIEVVPDYSPEVSIQSPPEKSLNVRLDETVLVETEALDPDFALSSVRLHGESRGRPKIDVPLLEKEHTGKFKGRFRFAPREHRLQVGDVVQYWIVADDVRTPEPNSTATEKRFFRIVSSDPAQQPPPDRVAQRDQRQQPGGQQGQQGQQGEAQDGGQGQQGSEGQQGGDDAQQQPGQSGQQRGNEQQQGQGGQSGGGESSPADGKQGGDSGEQNGLENGQSRSRENSDQRNHEQSQQGSGEQNPDGKQTGAGAAGGESSSGVPQPAGTRQPDQPGTGSARPDQGERTLGGGGDQRNGQPAESKPVSPNGDDDGAAFERIREHLERNGEMQDDKSDSPNADERNVDNSNSQSENGNPKQQGESTSEGNQSQNGREQAPTGDAQESLRHDENSSAAQRGTNQEARQEDESSPADSAEEQGRRADDQGEGAGADTRQDDINGQEKPPAETGEKTDSPGGQQTSTKGPSGAGQQPGKNQGVPDSNEKMKPAEKRQQSPSQESTSDDQEPPAPGEGKRESDSQGDAGGDRPGGGEEGGGQKANRDGTGSAGQNQSADEGAGESSEKGAGNNSTDAGQDATADRRTGQPGSDKPGAGSGEREGQGNKAGGKSGLGSDSAHPQKQPSNDKEPSDADKPTDSSATSGEQSQDGRQSPDGAGAPTGSGGDTGTSAGPPPSSNGTAPEGDAANLEYARRQTDLVLEKLSDQLKRKQVDEQMLKELGWSEDDLRAFVERWQRRKNAARNDDPGANGARRELDDALRSLGLRPGTLQQSNVREDQQRDLREGYRGPVPLEYRERLKAYNQGISRARREGE